jgi:hypothetical protein
VSEPIDDRDAPVHVVDKTQVKSWVSYGLPAAEALIVPPTVSFRVDEPAVNDGRVVTVRGLLENAGHAMVAVTVFTHGHGAAGNFGFIVAPAGSCARPKPRLGPPVPPAPPPPLVIELPARTAVRVWNQVVLEAYEWVPGAAIVLEWTFWFWYEPRPHGTVTVP